MQLTSPAFSDGQPIPVQYSCDGEDESPPLAVSGVPEQARSLVLIVDDPDAPRGTWDHWVVYDMDPSTTRFEPGQDVPGGGVPGRNSWGRNDYGGPCPPSGTHRYFFRLYALDAKLGLPPGANKQQVLDALKGHVLAEARLMGTFTR